MKTGATEFRVEGLTTEQVLESRARYGRNEVAKAKNNFLSVLKDTLTEPMVLLLLVAALLYFLSGKTHDGIFMTSAIIMVTGISWYQESKSRNALEELKTLTQPSCRVARDGKIVDIKREEIVVGDFMVVEEGTSIPADGVIVHANDFSVDESIITGESLTVYKSEEDQNNKVFQGTTVTGGLAICEVTAIGLLTVLGQIGKSIATIPEEETPLQKQINAFVKQMALAGVVVFFIVWGINFFASYNITDSLLKALTLAMSILPEEIPVAFATFMALGAWRLMKIGIIAKHTKTVETLGSATVICTDKTGTITENRMTLASTYVLSKRKFFRPEQSEIPDEDDKDLIRMAMWASEPIPFDPMEVALHAAYTNFTIQDERMNFGMVHEYPLDGQPPMMTHVFEDKAGNRIVAAKGAPEAMMKVSELRDVEKECLIDALGTMTAMGFRVLGVGSSTFSGHDFPLHQQALQFRFIGLIAFYDPPKKNIAEVFTAFYSAGIAVKIITGDNAATTATIARQINFKGWEQSMSGEELLSMSEEDVNKKVMETNIFTRMFPDAKLRILNALKANGQIVVMTGDGVNDAPALKAAHIGIAMGKRGSEIAKEVSSLILSDDDLGKMVDAVAMGRKIYANLKKAIQYIISIHIPIILTVFVPLVLGWIYPSIFSPVHVIFLELVMGPTCSIIYENEPVEKNAMLQPPRNLSTTFFRWRELGTSIIQGLVITIFILLVYQYAAHNSHDEQVTRAMVFVTLISANTFLTLVNRSFYYSVFTTIRYPNRLVPIIILVTLGLTASLLWITPFATIFQFGKVTWFQLAICGLAGCVSVVWIELVKAWRRKRQR